MRAWMFAAPLGFIAIDTGWIVRCVGRQPWIWVCTADSASHIPAGNVLVSLTAFTVIYILLLIAYLYFGSRIIRRGPKFDLPVLGVEPTKPAVNTTPESSFPTSPVEAQQ